VSGTIVTFYSYKGGVGRSFALANIAVLLANWGFKVLCIDWDLEAPGLSHFFANPNEPVGISKRRKGLVDLLSEFNRSKQFPLAWEDSVHRIDFISDNLSLMPAGVADENYSSRLSKLNWASLYRKGLGSALELMCGELRERFDFVLIDSRTGVTDFSGIVTAHLPDILAFLFTANEQSFNGSTEIARRSIVARNGMAIDRPPLLLLPIPARFETQVEHTISQSWRDRFSRDLQDFYLPWAAASIPLSRLVQATTIPYVPFWSFGEHLAVLEAKGSDSLSITFSLETIAALLAHRLDQTRLLADSRDEFVGSARRLADKGISERPSVFISHSNEELDLVSNFAQILTRNSVQVLQLPQPKSSVVPVESLSLEIERSQHMIVFLGERGNVTRWQDQEIRTFIRQASTDLRSRILIPIASSTAKLDQLPDLLRQYKIILAKDNLHEAIAEVLDLLEPKETNPRVKFSSVRIRASDPNERPISGVSITALADNQTSIDGKTDENGIAALELLNHKEYALLVAHPRSQAKIIQAFERNSTLDIRLILSSEVGSIVLHSTGYIPGLNGRLNPILDTENRTYLYADNIAINGGVNQPASFSVNEPFDLEDSSGNTFRVVVRHIATRIALLEYCRT
jgi:hypothetical protein